MAIFLIYKWLFFFKHNANFYVLWIIFKKQFKSYFKLIEFKGL